MTEQADQWICIKFCIKLEHSSIETIWRIQKAFGDSAMSAAQIQVWHKCFKGGWESVESDPHSRRPATGRTPENVEHVRAAINKDQRLTVRELETDLGIPKTTVSEILMQDLGMKRVVAKFILWILLPEQKEHCAAVANDNSNHCQWARFLKTVITRDESWVYSYSYDSEMKAQSSQWKSLGSPWPRESVAKSQQDHDHVNCVFFFIGKVLSMLLQARQLIRSTTSMSFISWEMQYDKNGHSYEQLLLGNFIRAMCLLMHLISCRNFWQNIKSARWLSTPYSPHLVPCDFWLFPKLKSPLKGKRFQTIDEIQENTTGQPMVIPTKDFAERFEQWKRRWKNCVRSQGAYFEREWDVIVLRTVFLISCIFFNKCL